VQELSDLFGLPDYWTVSPFFPLNPNSIRVDDAGKVFIPEDPSDLSKGERCIARLIHIEEKTYALPPTEQPWSDTEGICKKATSFIKDLFRSKDDKGLRKEGLHYISTALEAYSCKAYDNSDYDYYCSKQELHFGCSNVRDIRAFTRSRFSATIFLCADGKLRVIDSNYHAYVLNEFTIKIFPDEGKIGSHGVLHAPSIKLPLCRASEAPFLNDSNFLPEYLLPSRLQKKPETP